MKEAIKTWLLKKFTVTIREFIPGWLDVEFITVNKSISVNLNEYSSFAQAKQEIILKISKEVF